MATSKTKHFEVPTTLEYMGSEFQYRAVKLLLYDTNYLMMVAQRLKPEYFSAEGLSDVVGAIVNHWKATNLPATLDDVFLELKNRAGKDVTKQTKLHYTLTKIKDATDIGVEQVKCQLDNFLNVHFIFEMANDITNKATMESNFGKTQNLLVNLRDKIDLTLSSTLNENMDISPSDYVDAVFTEEEAERITTGEKVLDNIFNGGLPKGTVGGIIAPTGFGKSTLSTLLAYEAAIHGHKVVHFFFEDMPNDVAKKYFARMSGIEISKMRKGNDEFRSSIENDEHLRLLKENCRVESMPNGQTTVEDLELVLRRLSNVHGFKAEVVFIDYYDCLKLSRNAFKEELTADKGCMKKLEFLAKKLNIALWIGFQTNRTVTPPQSDSEFALGKCIQGSFHRLQTCAYTIGLRNDPMYGEDRRAFEIEKNRGGRRCIIHNVIVDNGTVSIDWNNMQTVYIDQGGDKGEYTIDDDLAYNDEPTIPVGRFELHLGED